MKKIITAIILFSLALTCIASEEIEKEFEARFKAFIENKSLNPEELDKVRMKADSPPQNQTLHSMRNFEQAMTRGISSIKLVEIYPMMKERVSKPIEERGVKYVLNIKPYKMLEVEYIEKIEGGSSGWSSLIGISEGKLYLAGFERQNQAGDDNSE